MFYGKDRIRFVSRVVAVGPGWVQFERPLPYDIRTKWKVSREGDRRTAGDGAPAHPGMASKSCLPGCGPTPGGLQMLRLPPCSACVQPQLHRFTPTVVESGFENFSILFKWSECPLPSRLCPAVDRPTPVPHRMPRPGAPEHTPGGTHHQHHCLPRVVQTSAYSATALGVALNGSAGCVFPLTRPLPRPPGCQGHERYLLDGPGQLLGIQRELTRLARPPSPAHGQPPGMQ